jgi:general secretion pathway protein A
LLSPKQAVGSSSGEPPHPENQWPYLTSFGLSREPFSLGPANEFLYLSQGHAEALAALEVGILGRRGLVVLVGDVGVGKTSLAHGVLRELGSHVHATYITSPTIGFTEILQQTLLNLGLSELDDRKGTLLGALGEALRVAHLREHVVALILDEAQDLSDDTLKELRLLLNFETESSKLLQVVLIGQPELHDRLLQAPLRNLANRIAVRCVLNPLSARESREYLEARLRRAGGSLQVFTPAAIRILVRESRGVARSLNVLAHNALLFAYGESLRRVNAACARKAVRERRGVGLERLGRRGLSKRWGLWLAVLVGLAALVVAILFVLALASGRSSSEPDETHAAMTQGSRAAPEPTTSPPLSPSERQPSLSEAAPTASTEDLPLRDSSSQSSHAAQELNDLVETILPVTKLVVPGDTLFDLISEVYDTYSLAHVDALLEANPYIDDPNLLLPGVEIRFPVVSTETSLPEP